MKLSVITINLNNANGLKKTIQSFADQNFSDAEMIVIDGGSSDGSKEVIEAHKNHIAQWVSEKDGGIYHAQNKGLGLAKGEYCLFLNSGDYFATTDVLTNIFSGNYPEDLLYGNMIIQRKDGSSYPGKMPEDLSFHHMIADTLWHPVTFIRKSLFEAFGKYDETLKMVADYDFFLKVLIVHNVSRRYFDFPISVFNLDGFSSNPDNRKLQQEERTAVQLRYFPPAVIESAKKLNALLGSKWYRLLQLLKFV